MQKTQVNKTHLEARPPVVAILGHIDHGKSTLLDYIRKTNITAKEAGRRHAEAGFGLAEAGGITQHVSAYEIMRTAKDGKSKKITFIDTPGHEAFINLRTRSSSAADIAALIVSAEDGIKPQSLEVLKYIKENSIPFIVVITKIDKPTADIARTKQSLAENEVYVEGYGGNTPVIELSAKTGQGVDDFLDMIDLMTELEGKTAERDALGQGVIIESRRDAKRGVVAVGIIKNGTIRRGLFAATRGATAPMRFLLDSEGNMVEELSFSSPVQIVGWDNMPVTGEEFRTFLQKEDAFKYAEEKQNQTDQKKKRVETREDMAFLPLILKADTTGTLEAVTGELEKISRERIAPKIIFSGVGEINENDVKSAISTPQSMIFGFNIKTDAKAAALAERSSISILSFNIIYELTDKIKEILQEKEPRIEVEEITSTAKVLRLFDASRNKQIIGGRVQSGIFKKGANIKIIRREAEIGRGKIKELQQSKIAADTVNEGNEFGAMIESKIEIAVGDTLGTVTLVIK